MTFRKIKPKSRKDMMDGPAQTSDKKVFPHFRIELIHLPEARKWKVEEEYEVGLKLKMTGISISKFQNDVEFDIIGIDPKAKVKNSEHNSDHA